MDHGSQLSREPRGHLLVPAGDPRGAQGSHGGDVGDDLRGQGPERSCAGHLDARLERLPHAGLERQTVERLGDADPLTGSYAREQRRRGGEAVGGRADPTAGLADVVAHAGVADLETEARAQVALHVVAVEHELRAALHDRHPQRAFDRRGPDSSPNTVARLEHDDVVTGPDEDVGARQPGEPGPDHDHPHDAPLPSS